MRPGSRIGARQPRTYELLERVGEGGFGRVYRARQLGLEGPGKEVAIKIVAESFGLSAQRIRREARLLASIRHRAVVGVDDLLRLPQGWALVMEYVEGLDLADVIAREALPLPVAAEIVSEVAGALACAGPLRGAGGRPMWLQHRDIKPANIRLTLQGGIKLLDFGISWAVIDGESEAAIPYGSRGYISPERARKADHHTSDLFALGVVLYEMLTARICGPAPTEASGHGPWVAGRIEGLPAGTPPAARRLIEELLAWDPEDRPSAREVERRASALARSSPPSLRDWSELRLPVLRASPRSAPRTWTSRSGRTWAFTPTPPLSPPEALGERSRSLRLLLVAALLALLGGWFVSTAWQGAQQAGPPMALQP